MSSSWWGDFGEPPACLLKLLYNSGSMHTSMRTPFIVDFPLRGAWIAPNTPGTRIPSHGTDALGERYAYDFVGINPRRRDNRFYRSSPLRYLIFGVRLQACYGWGQPIYAATDGVVLQADDGWPERDPVHPIRDIHVMLKNARAFNANQLSDLRTLTGNFILVESQVGYVVYAHAQTGSVRVAVGDRVVTGQHLANVGHSGNSTAPHLHFHLMDQPDPWKAQGIPCAFQDYEVFQAGAWRPVQHGIPKASERIRKL
jgi:murein DD-endopeptidase MepM/ murein hydrolase activator NlpD